MYDYKRILMNYIQTDIEGPLIVEPRIFGDHRGYFFESFSLRNSHFVNGIVLILILRFL